MMTIPMTTHATATALATALGTIQQTKASWRNLQRTPIRGRTPRQLRRNAQTSRGAAQPSTATNIN